MDLTKLTKNFKKNLYWNLTIVIIILILSIPFYISVLLKLLDQASPKQPRSDFVICTGLVKQPNCYDGDFPRPKFNWNFKAEKGISKQVACRVQIDDNGDFSSPEIDTGEVINADNVYTINKDGLIPNKEYYWRLKIKDTFNIWSDWVQGDETFIAVPFCKSGLNNNDCFYDCFYALSLNCG